MIGHFPIPYPGELFYSVCARFSDRLHYPTLRAVAEELLGTTTATAVIGLPSHLEYLATHLPPSYPVSLEQLIDRHTLLPFYAPFLPVSHLRQLGADMRGMNGKAMSRRVTATASYVSMPAWLRFCPLCVQEDRAQWGEGYWHRLHQAPGVEVCPTHAVWLEQSEARARYRKSAKEFISAERVIRTTPPRRLDLSNTCQRMLFDLARDVDWLLHQSGVAAHLETVQQRYAVALIQRKSASQSGTLYDVSALWRAFKAYYPPDLFQLLHCKLDERLDKRWMSYLMRVPNRRCPPLCHLLMIHFLGYTLQEFLSLPTEHHPFGEGPWPCLNPVSDHSQQRVVAECVWIKPPDRSQPVGTFACPLCGFVYTRVGPDQSPEDHFQRSRDVKAYGPVWEAELSRLWNTPHTSLRHIAHQLGIGLALLRQYAARLDLPIPRPGNSNCLAPLKRAIPANTPTPAPLPVEDYRARWLAHLKEHPDVGRTKLAKANRPVYHWLHRYDPAWLESNLPSCRAPRRRPRRANWEERDRQLVTAVEQAATSIRNLPGHPVQVTRAAVGRETGKLTWLNYALDALPLTADALATVTETCEEFAVRKIEWAAGQYHQENIRPTRTKLIGRAGIRELAQHPQVKAALDAALQKLSQLETAVRV